MKTRTTTALGALVVTALAAGGVAIVATADSSQKAATTTTSAPPATTPGPPDFAGTWTERCAYDHTAKDDPIVHFDMPGMSHDHDFFGAVGVRADTIPSDITGGPTTCLIIGARNMPGLSHAVWTPAMFVCIGTPIGETCTPDMPNAVRLVPKSATLRFASGGRGRDIAPLPQDLQIVAGATSTPPIKESKETDWACFNRPGEAYERNTDFRGCPPDTSVHMSIGFPDCWDGKNTFNPINFRAHMAYSDTRRRCPATHPVPVVKLLVTVDFGKNIPQNAIAMASGIDKTIHADFFNTPDPVRLEQLMRNCVYQRLVKCENLP